MWFAVSMVLVLAPSIGISALDAGPITLIAVNVDARDFRIVDFEDGVILYPSVGRVFEGPLGSTTDNGVFAPGDIPTGIRFENSCSPTGDLVLAGAGFDLWGWSGTGGFPSKVLIPSNDACSLSIFFDPPVDLVALDIYAESDSGYRVSVYGRYGALVTHVDGVAGETVPGYFGYSDTRVSRIDVKAPSGSPTGSFEAVDEVVYAVLPLFIDGFESGSTGAWSN